MKKILLYSIVSIIACSIYAQDSTSTYSRQAIQNTDSPTKPGKSKFMLRGYAHSGFESVFKENDTESNFVGGSFNPILLYKQSDRLFFEGEFEGAYENGLFEFGLEYADISYILNKYMTVRVGKFLLPFGTFGEKLHPAWINRLATKPLGIGHDGIVPTSDVGVELRGAGYFGKLKWNYQLYVINGPQLKDGSIEAEEAGMLNFGFATDNNKNKTVGGRFAFFPFSNSSTEIGFSGMSGKVGAEGSIYENVSALLGAVDFSLVKNIGFLKGVIDIKGQYNYSSIDNASYVLPDTAQVIYYDFVNQSNAYYAQLSYRPAFIGNDFIKKLEFVGRYSSLTTPEGSLWEQKPTSLAFGINYWLDWRTVLKIGYQTVNGAAGEHDEASEVAGEEAPKNETVNMFYIHWAIGF